MIHETFCLDGCCAESVGIRLQKPIEFSEPKPVVGTKQVPGRNGDLLFPTGAYENRKGVASCFALSKEVVQNIGAINDFLLSKSGYRRLVCNDDLDHFRFARVVNGARVEHRLRALAPFEIVFDCKPQRFLISGEYALPFMESGTLLNPTNQIALPKIVVYGTGAGEVNVNGTTVRIDAITDPIILDCEVENAYSEVEGSAAVNQNGNIYAPKFPTLSPGTNTVSFSGGITKLEIIPRWWTL